MYDFSRRCFCALFDHSYLLNFAIKSVELEHIQQLDFCSFDELNFDQQIGFLLATVYIYMADSMMFGKNLLFDGFLRELRFFGV